jgi:hypothetical protein
MQHGVPLPPGGGIVAQPAAHALADDEGSQTSATKTAAATTLGVVLRESAGQILVDHLLAGGTSLLTACSQASSGNLGPFLHSCPAALPTISVRNKQVADALVLPFSAFLLPFQPPPSHPPLVLFLSGPAIHSTALVGGDRIVRIDGVEVTPENFERLLKGCDVPGNVATLTIVKREAEGGAGGGGRWGRTASSSSRGFRFVSDIAADGGGESGGETQVVDVKLRRMAHAEMIDYVSIVCIWLFTCLCLRLWVVTIFLTLLQRIPFMFCWYTRAVTGEDVRAF